MGTYSTMSEEEPAISATASQVLEAFKKPSRDDKEELMQCHFMDEVGWYTLDNRPSMHEEDGALKYDIQRGIYHMDSQTIIDKATVEHMTAIHKMFATQTKAMSFDNGCNRTRLILWAQTEKDWLPGTETPGSYHLVRDGVGKALLDCYKSPRQFGHVSVFYYEASDISDAGVTGSRLEKICMSILVHHYADNRQKLIDAGYDVSEVDKAYNYDAH